jgi:TRAP-type C4-dicarboxylate transport system permease small subunit
MADSSETQGAGNGGLIRRVDKSFAVLEDLFNGVAGLFIVALMFFTCAEVVGRRVFNAPIPGAIDYIEVVMVTFAFLGVAACQRDGGHIRMELVMAQLKGRLLWTLEFFAVLLALVFVVILIEQSWNHFMRSFTLGDSTIDIQLQLWPSKLLVPIALVLLAVRLTINMWGYIRLVVDPNREAIGVPVIKDVVEEAKEEVEVALRRGGVVLDEDDNGQQSR